MNKNRGTINLTPYILQNMVKKTIKNVPFLYEKRLIFDFFPHNETEDRDVVEVVL